jgi:hypothetical protein
MDPRAEREVVLSPSEKSPELPELLVVVRFNEYALFRVEEALQMATPEIAGRARRAEIGFRDCLAIAYAGLEGARAYAKAKKLRAGRRDPWTIEEVATLFEPYGGVVHNFDPIREAFFVAVFGPPIETPSGKGAAVADGAEATAPTIVAPTT